MGREGRYDQAGLALQSSNLPRALACGCERGFPRAAMIPALSRVSAARGSPPLLVRKDPRHPVPATAPPRPALATGMGPAMGPRMVLQQVTHISRTYPRRSVPDIGGHRRRNAGRVGRLPATNRTPTAGGVAGSGEALRRGEEPDGRNVDMSGSPAGRVGRSTLGACGQPCAACRPLGT